MESCWVCEPVGERHDPAALHYVLVRKQRGQGKGQAAKHNENSYPSQEERKRTGQRLSLLQEP